MLQGMSPRTGAREQAEADAGRLIPDACPAAQGDLSSTSEGRMTRGIHDGIHEPVVAPKRPGEDVLDYLARICQANGWPVPELHESVRRKRDPRGVTERIDAIFKPPSEPGENG